MCNITNAIKDVKVIDKKMTLCVKNNNKIAFLTFKKSTCQIFFIMILFDGQNILKQNSMKTKVNKEADMMIGKICGTGSSIPVKIMDNDDLSNMVDTNDAWIRERTGVEKRHIAESESTVSMAVEAGRQALAQTGVRPGRVGYDSGVNDVTGCSASLYSLRSAKGYRCRGCNVCFDLQAACTGFIFAYNTAQAYIQSNMCRTVLLIGSERLSRLVDWTDRGTCILFGDGAGAAVLKAAEGELIFRFLILMEKRERL